MTRHLVDNVPVGWSQLGTDLLDGTPEALRQALPWPPSSPSQSLDDVFSSDGTPPSRITITETSTEGLDWGYVLRSHGIEVIGLREHSRGPVLAWDTDPAARFSDSQHRWAPNLAPPVTTRPGTAPPPPQPSPSKRAAPHR
ncbi:hypothetical protein [Streptomyces sp. NPDC005012]|uniref:hypothetical protein n=1 Tax=Streptomyces sp. NPDC005012 TaxID=3154558 RepID=UPI0033A977D7